MAQELVWAVVGGTATAVSRSYAKKKNLRVLDESPYDATGQVRRPTRHNGRPVKPKTTVAEAAAKKAGAVIGSDSADTTIDTPEGV